MSNENELLEPLATEAGQLAIVRAIRDISSLEYAVRAEQAASLASAKAGEASQSAIEASDAESKAKDWATKTDTYVEQQIITIPPVQEGEEPTTETINLYSARYYAALALDIYNNMSFDSVPTENSTNMVSSGTVYSSLDLKADKSTTYTKTETDNLINTRLAELVASAPAALDTLQELATALGNDPNFATTIATQLGNKADKSDTYTKTEVDTALSNVQSTLTFDNVPTANSDNPVKSSGIKTALDGKQDTLTFDSTPTANSTNPVTSDGVYTALQNVNIDIDDEITEDSDNPVTSAAIYEALQNLPSGGGSGDVVAGSIQSGMVEDVLFESSTTAGVYRGTINLSGKISDYDLIVFETNRYVDNHSLNQNRNIFVASSLHELTGDTSYSNCILLNGYYTDYLKLAYVNDNTLNAFESTLLRLIKITGIKFCKNLSEQMYSNVLYENASGWNSGNITLSDSLDNYDFIEVLGKLIDFQSVFSMYCNINLINNDNKFLFCGYEGNYIYVNKISSTELLAGTRRGFSIYKIIGHKLAKGGYSGIVSDARMTVKSGHVTLNLAITNGTDGTIDVIFDSPMPDTNYQVFLNNGTNTEYYTNAHPRVNENSKTVNGFTISIFATGNVGAGINFDWIAIRPNSYTREGMVEDVLFSNASGVNSGTINLSGNISDYDLILFKWRADSHTGTNEKYGSNIVLCSLLQEHIGKKYELDAYDQRYIAFYLTSDSSFTIDARSELGIYKITGIKFGRYVSGVAVDTTVTQNSNAVVTSGAVYDALQHIPSGGGSSITVDSTITQGGTNPVEGGAIYTALDGKADKSDTYTKTEVDTALSSKGDVTTDTAQNITGTKTFVGSKKIAFKLSAANDKLGFTLFSNSNAERGYLEFNPTNTVDGVTGLMTLGNYATSAASLTQVGFRRYSNISGASGAYNLLMPMVADARTPFSLTTNYTNFYLPLGFTDGTTTVKTAKSGVVDLSPLLASLEARIAALEGN